MPERAYHSSYNDRFELVCGWDKHPDPSSSHGHDRAQYETFPESPLVEHFDNYEVAGNVAYQEHKCLQLDVHLVAVVDLRYGIGNWRESHHYEAVGKESQSETELDRPSLRGQKIVVVA